MTNPLAAATPKPLVLFVDDMPDIREMVEVGMRHYDPPFAVAFAETVESALRVVRESRPAAVVLDINLAGETGMDIAEHLHEYEPRIPKAVLTAYDLSIAHANAEELGMDVWPKTLTMPDLIDRVIALLAKRPAEAGGFGATVPRVARALVAAMFGLVGGGHVPRLH